MIREYLPLMGMISLVLGLGMIYFHATTDLNIARYIKDGNAAELATCFNEDIEMIFPNGDMISGVEDCEKSMAHFFDIYPPLEFFIIHRGKNTSNAKMYYIGHYKSTKEDFRITIMVEDMIVDNIIIDNDDKRISINY